MSQLALPLAWPAEDENGFIVAAANRQAVRHLEHPALWPVMTTILTGPRRSGRSLLGRLFVQRSGGTLIDDADRKPEEALFHAWNAAQANRRPLLLVADARPPAWAVTLPDLASRLAATPSIAIEEPDDALMGALIERRLAARGLAIGPEVVRWLLPRMPRTYLGIERVVDALDTASLAERRRVTVPFARATLAGVIDLSHESA